MARLDLAVEHCQPPEEAQSRFESGIEEAVSRYGSWIDRVAWAEDRESVTFSGSGYEVRLWYDDRLLHAQGTIPLAWKLLEPAVKHHIRKMLDSPR